MKCKNCIYYKPINTKEGDCWGRRIEGNANPKDIKICQGRYFKKTDPIINQIKYLFVLGERRTSLWI